MTKWDGSKFANSLILEGTKQINVEGVINTNTEDVVVSLKNKYRNLLSYNNNALLIFQDSIYSGSSYISNFGYGFGFGALYSNSGSNSNGFGQASLQLNSGAYSNGYGTYALQSNSGSYSNGFGANSLQYNTGASSNGFGNLALQYNNYANAIGIGYQSTPAFLEDVTTTKNFTDTEVTANTITFTAAHGFGTNGTKVNLKFKTVTGTPPTGLANNSVYQFTITSATVLTLAGIGTNASLDFEGSLTKNLNITNSIAIGTDVNATKQNQIVLGSSTYAETLLFGNVGIKKTPTEALDVNGNLIADILKSRIPTGTAPLVVASTTKVDNLNADLLDGQHGNYYQAASPKIKLTPEGGYAVLLTNKTGANSVKGSVVIADPAVDNAFEINPINGDMPFGVVYESGIADGSECWVVVSGIAEVLLVNTVASTRSYVAYSSGSVAGRIDIAASVPAATTHFKEIGHTLESKTGGTNVLCKCVLHFN